jgi:hypothetical protein
MVSLSTLPDLRRASPFSSQRFDHRSRPAPTKRPGGAAAFRRTRHAVGRSRESVRSACDRHLVREGRRTARSKIDVPTAHFWHLRHGRSRRPTAASNPARRVSRASRWSGGSRGFAAPIDSETLSPAPRWATIDWANSCSSWAPPTPVLFPPPGDPDNTTLRSEVDRLTQQGLSGSGCTPYNKRPAALRPDPSALGGFVCRQGQRPLFFLSAGVESSG